jgi:hypothetical protein
MVSDTVLSLGHRFFDATGSRPAFLLRHFSNAGSVRACSLTGSEGL